MIRERVLAGMREARRKGKHCGRPMIEFDVDQAAELRRAGMSWRKMAAATGVPVHLLRARLSEFSRQNPAMESVTVGEG